MSEKKRSLIYISIIIIVSSILIFIAVSTAVRFTSFVRSWRKLKNDVSTLRNNMDYLVAKSYEMPWAVEESEESDAYGNNFVFVGHIYSYNGFRSPDKPQFPDTGETIRSFISFMNRLQPKRVIFGGDNIWNGSRDKLIYLKRDIIDSLDSEVRVLIGNHDLNPDGKGVLSHPDLFKKVYGRKYFFEDVEGIRLIYLNSVTKEGQYDLDNDQVQFLAEALSSDKYNVALLFLHHALWLAGSPYVNASYPEPKAARLSWEEIIIPLLIDGRVKGVFAGDGGVWHETVVANIENIPHYLTGWSFDLNKRPAAFLRIKVLNGSVNVFRNIIFGNSIYKVRIMDISPK